MKPQVWMAGDCVCYHIFTLHQIPGRPLCLHKGSSDFRSPLEREISGTSTGAAPTARITGSSCQSPATSEFVQASSQLKSKNKNPLHKLPLANHLTTAQENRKLETLLTKLRT